MDSGLDIRWIYLYHVMNTITELEHWSRPWLTSLLWKWPLYLDQFNKDALFQTISQPTTTLAPTGAKMALAWTVDEPPTRLPRFMVTMLIANITHIISTRMLRRKCRVSPLTGRRDIDA